MKKKGFTLIELLVTITILAIISSIGLVAFGKARMVGRDGKRKNDLRQVASALELYKQANGRYPCSSTEWVLSTETFTNWITDSGYNVSPCPGSATNSKKILDQTYINQMPIDPSSNGGNPTTGNNKGYAYGFASTVTPASSNPCPSTLSGNYYVLVTTLENPEDKDADIKKHETYKYCDGTYIFGASNEKGFAVMSP